MLVNGNFFTALSDWRRQLPSLQCVVSCDSHAARESMQCFALDGGVWPIILLLWPRPCVSRHAAASLTMHLTKASYQINDGGKRAGKACANLDVQDRKSQTLFSLNFPIVNNAFVIAGACNGSISQLLWDLLKWPFLLNVFGLCYLFCHTRSHCKLALPKGYHPKEVW